MPETPKPEYEKSDYGKRRLRPRFQGEWMTCKGCGKREQSNKKRQSHWTFIEIDDTGFYICPVCFGNGTRTRLLQDAMRDS